MSCYATDQRDAYKLKAPAHLFWNIDAQIAKDR